MKICLKHGDFIINKGKIPNFLFYFYIKGKDEESTEKNDFQHENFYNITSSIESLTISPSASKGWNFLAHGKNVRY